MDVIMPTEQSQIATEWRLSPKVTSRIPRDDVRESRRMWCRFIPNPMSKTNILVTSNMSPLL